MDDRETPISCLLRRPLGMEPQPGLCPDRPGIRPETSWCEMTPSH